MNDRLTEPVQETMSDEDFAMIVQEMARSPGYREEYARRKARFDQLREDILSRQKNRPELEEPEPEPIQEMMSDEDFSMIVQEMTKTPGYYQGRARRIAAINKYRDFLLSLGPIPNAFVKEIRDEDQA